MAHSFTFDQEILGARLTCEINVESGSREEFLVEFAPQPIDDKSLVVRAAIRRIDGGPFVLEKFRAAVWVPLVDIHGVWSWHGDRAETGRVPWHHHSVTAANRGFPFVMLISRSGVNRLAFGLFDQVSETSMVYHMDELHAGYQASFEKPLLEEGLARTSYEESIYLSHRAEPWYRAVGAYVLANDRASGFEPVRVPDAAWDPVYCTWYAVHHDATAEWIEKQVKIAADLGFRTLIVDDGWFFHGHGDWGGYARTGDWVVAESKFPDLVGHVKRVQGMGVKYLLWTAPFMVGTMSDNFRLLSRLLHPHDHGSYRCLCPRTQEAHDHLVGLMKNLMATYGLDGFKMDFIDAVEPTPCSGDHSHDYETHGHGIDTALRRIYAELSALNPDVLLEFRQSYANLAGRAYSTAFRAGDAPMDADTNLWRITMIRSYSGQTPAHFDPAYWHPEESEESVARHMISSTFCVPMISLDLTKLPANHLRIIKRWMDFYHANKALVSRGRFEPNVSNAAIETITIREGHRAIVGMFCGPAIPVLSNDVDEVQVPNASNFDSLVPHGALEGWVYQVEGRFGDTLSDGRVGRTAIGVPVGGLLRMQRRG